ncbi:MAG TPA: hypothetical protein VFV93_04390 [Thermomicrobiales bacterium]|nr:hypothetical protein [Thermomicrobiales bacterium]
MQQIVYAMQFHGEGAPADDGTMHAATRAPSMRITSSVGGAGLTGSIDEVDGGEATFTSVVRMTGETSFIETGTITFGDGNSVDFSTVGEGFMGPSPQPGLLHGVISWQIDSGTGQFAGASGLITSNFTFSEQGEVIDNQFGVIWLA